MQTPRALGLPYDDWRPGQRKAIRTILNADTTHIMVNAPTGSGKSGIVAALPNLDDERRFIVLTGTLALQDVYAVFPHLLDLRGARHYECLAARGEFAGWFKGRKGRITCDEGPCHLQQGCALKDDGCGYFDAKRAFVASHAGRTNYAAWLSNRRVGTGLGTADMVVCDEAHALPEQLMSASRVDIPYDLLDARPPRGWRKWVRWADERLTMLEEKELMISGEGMNREQLARSLKTLSQMDDTWAWEEDVEGFHFEPTIPKLLLPLLQTFDGVSQVAYLSATITPSMLDLFDINADDVTYLELPSTFPVERRPIYLVPGAKGSWKSMQDPDNWTSLMDAIDEICEDRDDRRGIIHSVSFERARQIVLSSRERGRMILHTPGESGQAVVARFREAGPTAILVSPSVMTGHDFPYEQAEFNILAKMPFPNTSSPIMRKRCEMTPRYREHYTMQHVVQACGRVNRAEDDFGETFIVDADFRWWYRHHRDLAPDYFDAALVTTRRRVVPPPPLRRAA